MNKKYIEHLKSLPKLEIIERYLQVTENIDDIVSENKELRKQLRIYGVVKSFYCYDETVQIAEETGDKIIKCDKQCEKCKQ